MKTFLNFGKKENVEHNLMLSFEEFGIDLATPK